jgi:hypothetical protein
MQSTQDLIDAVANSHDLEEALTKEIEALSVVGKILAASSQEVDFLAGMRVGRLYRMKRLERHQVRSIRGDLEAELEELCGAL